MVTADQQDAYLRLWCTSKLDSQRQNALRPQPNLATIHEQVKMMLLFEHLDELHSLHYAALLIVTSASHQTAELKANILAVLAYDILATGHALHKSKNGHHNYLLTNGFYAWLCHWDPAGPGTQHQTNQVQ